MNIHDLRSRILDWARETDNIRAVIETGAYARQTPPTPDEFSDLDIEFYCQTPALLLENADWMAQITPVWAYQALDNDTWNPTRLVLFEDGLKVDFMIADAHLLQQGTYTQAQQNGFRIWLDKDGVLNDWQVPLPSHRQPTIEQWRATLAEFWIEAWNWAKYLSRGDAWHAKIRDNDTKNAMLLMLEWHALANGQTPSHAGHHLGSWTEADIWPQIPALWCDLTPHSNWQSLKDSCALFERLSREVAQKWELPLEIVNHTPIWEQIREMRARFDFKPD